MKRKFEETDLSDDDEICEKKSKWNGQVYTFSFCWNYSVKYGMSLEDFKSKHKELCETLKSVAGKKGRFIFQLECTERSEEEREGAGGYDNWHYQGYLKVSNKRRPRTVGAELGEGFPGIQFNVCSTNGQSALRDYCMKRDGSYRAGPWCEEGEVKVKEEYKGDDLPSSLYPWQDSISKIVVTKPDDRTINWVHDEVGGIGKTKLVKKLCFEGKGDVVFLSFGNASDLLYQVVKRGERKVYLLDLQRTKSKNWHMDDIYAALEAIKNGMVFSTKYDGGELMMDPPHVWVFSNYMPEREKMSKDRFKIWRVQNKELAEAEPKIAHHYSGPALCEEGYEED